MIVIASDSFHNVTLTSDKPQTLRLFKQTVTSTSSRNKNNNNNASEAYVIQAEAFSGFLRFFFRRLAPIIKSPIYYFRFGPRFYKSYVVYIGCTSVQCRYFHIRRYRTTALTWPKQRKLSRSFVPLCLVL